MFLRRSLIWFLLAALVTAQALGLMHKIVHAPHAAAQAQTSAPCETNWVHALFSGHSDDSSCRLFDPLNHDGPPTVPVVALPLLLTSFFLDTFAGEFLVRWAALFDARGPPPLR